MKRTRTITAPGRDLEITLPLGGSASVPCSPDPTGLFWFSDLTGAFDQDAEAAYLLPEGGAGPLLGLARVLGETCGDVTWTHAWTPASGTGGDPGIVEDGADLLVYPLADSKPGILEVTAECAGKTFGPVLLSVLKYACYYIPCPTSAPANQIGGWLRLPDNYGYASYSGTLAQYGGLDGVINIGVNQVTTVNFSSISASNVWIYCNDGGGGYYRVNGDGVNRTPQRGSFSPPWSGSGAPVSISGLTSLELHSDGYGAGWYVFVK